MLGLRLGLFFQTSSGEFCDRMSFRLVLTASAHSEEKCLREYVSFRHAAVMGFKFEFLREEVTYA